MTIATSLDVSPADLHAHILGGESDRHVFGGGVDYAKWFTEDHVSYRDPETGRNLLHVIAMAGRTGALNWLLELTEDHGAQAIFKLVDPNATDAFGCTPLMLAVQRVTGPDAATKTSAHMAPFFELLALHTANLQAPMPNGLSPLSTLVVEFPNNYAEIAWKFTAILAANGAKIGHRDARVCACAALATLNEPALDMAIKSLEANGRTLAESLDERGMFDTLVILADLQENWCSHDTSSVFSLVSHRGVDLTGTDTRMRDITSIARQTGLAKKAMMRLQDTLFRQTAARALG